MILNVVFKLLVAFLGFSISYVIHRLYHNHQAHQFFKKKAPYLFVRPIPSILAGNGDAIYSLRVCRDNYEHHLKYGTTVCFYYGDVPIVSTLDLDFIKKFAIDDANSHINRLNPNSGVDEFEVDSLLFARDKQWHRLRKAIGPAFSLHKIKSPNVISGMNEVINEFIESLEWRLDRAKRENNEEFIIIDAEELCHRYSLAIVFKCLYKQSNVIDFKTEHDKTQQFLEKGYRDFGMATYLFKLNLMFPILKPIVRLVFKFFNPIAPVKKQILDFIRQQMELYFEAKKQITEAKKRADGDSKMSLDEFNTKDGGIFRKNLTDYVIEKYAEGAMTEREYIHSTFFLFVAADKTTSDAVSKIMYCLAAHQDVQDKVRQFILAEGKESKYLLWTINEALRLHPPVLMGSSRVLTKDMESIDGIIPAGCFIITPVYAINRLKKYWGDDADHFRPERWENSRNFHPVQFLSFGVGKRSCLGKEMAMHELKVLFSTLLTKCKLELTDRALHIDEFMSPFFAFNHAEYPTWIKISRL